MVIHSTTKDILVNIPHSIEWLKTSAEQEKAQQEMVDMEKAITSLIGNEMAKKTGDTNKICLK